MSDAAAKSDSVLLAETRGGVRILTMNRPAKKNALSDDLVQALVEAFEGAAADDEVRVVGLTGAGDAFCAGADLAAPATGSDRTIMADRVVRLVRGMRVDCEKPVVAGVDGIAIGAGLSLALCADIRVASARARFHPGYARVGSSPDCGLTWTLPQAIGRERAMRFLLDVRTTDAETALGIGLVSEVAPEDRFDEVFRGCCDRIAQVPPLASRQTKRMVTRADLLDDLDAHLRDELDLAAHALRSEEGREAVRAIFKRRKPDPNG